MTFEEYLESGGDREERLVTIYKIQPERLSDEYRGLLTAMDSPNVYVSQYIDKTSDLYGVVKNWDRIKKDLVRQGADFV